MKTWLQSILLLRDDKQQVATNGYPYLRVDNIACCVIKSLDMQILLIHLTKICYLSGIILRPDLQVLRSKIKSSLNISQTTAISELCKAHYQKLISAIELYSMSVTVISFDAFAEFILGEERHKLREDCFTFIHGLQEPALIPFCKLKNSNRKIFFVL